MTKVLWILNKYVTGNNDERYYPEFLFHLQDELSKVDIQLHFILFSDQMKIKNEKPLKYLHYYRAENYDNISSKQLDLEANRIESEYEFTFKQAWFPEILQISKHQNNRKIGVPEAELNDLGPLVKKFLFLENVISKEKIFVIFSDVSPEAEMEFGRAIGLKYKIKVIKSYEGSFLGRTVLLKHSKFGKDDLIVAQNQNPPKREAVELFIDQYISNQGQPSYLSMKRLEQHISVSERLLTKISKKKWKIIALPFDYLNRALYNLWLSFESSVLKRLIYDKYISNDLYFFMGFHLNQESTMGLRSLPYVNQIALLEMISRVLPFKYKLYVREHPHWPKTFPFRYLNKVKSLPNIKLLSPNVPIHDILKNSRGALVYNSNTGIEALMHGKPVLSFASTIYFKHHPAVLYCDDLFQLGEKLIQLLKTSVKREDTIVYLQKMYQVSVDYLMNSYYFTSEEDAKKKAISFAEMLNTAIRI
jgi:hypothetical protein